MKGNRFEVLSSDEPVEDELVPIKSQFTFTVANPCASTGFAKEPFSSSASNQTHASANSGVKSPVVLRRCTLPRKPSRLAEGGSDDNESYQSWNNLTPSVPTSPSKQPRVKLPVVCSNDDTAGEGPSSIKNIDRRASSESYFDNYDPVPTPYRLANFNDTNVINNAFDLAKAFPTVCGRELPVPDFESYKVDASRADRPKPDNSNAAKLPQMSSHTEDDSPFISKPYRATSLTNFEKMGMEYLRTQFPWAGNPDLLFSLSGPMRADIRPAACGNDWDDPNIVIPTEDSALIKGEYASTRLAQDWCRYFNEYGHSTESEHQDNFIERQTILPFDHHGASSNILEPQPAAEEEPAIAENRTGSTLARTSCVCACQCCQSQTHPPQTQELCGVFPPGPVTSYSPLPTPPYHIDELREQFIPAQVWYPGSAFRRSGVQMAICPSPACHALVQIQPYNHPLSPAPIANASGPSLPAVSRPIPAPTTEEQKTVNAVAGDLGFDNSHSEACHFSASAPVYQGEEIAEDQPELEHEPPAQRPSCEIDGRTQEEFVLYLDHDWSDAAEAQDSDDECAENYLTPRSWEGGEDEFWV